MCTKKQLDEISRLVALSYRRTLGDSIWKIMLYGSYARGTNDDESDIDYACIASGERMELQQKEMDIWHDTNKIGLDYNVVISPVVIPYDEFERYKTLLPYYRNIEREGVLIG